MILNNVDINRDINIIANGRTEQFICRQVSAAD